MREKGLLGYPLVVSTFLQKIKTLIVFFVFKLFWWGPKENLFLGTNVCKISDVMLKSTGISRPT